METFNDQQRFVNTRENTGIQSRESGYEFVLDGSLPPESLGNYALTAVNVRTGSRL